MGRTQEFRKVWARAPEVEKGAKKGSQIFFKILNFENVDFSKLLSAIVDVGIFIAYFWRKKCNVI